MLTSVGVPGRSAQAFVIERIQEGEKLLSKGGGRDSAGLEELRREADDLGSRLAESELRCAERDARLKTSEAETESWRVNHEELAASSGVEIENLRNLLHKAQEDARTAADKARAEEESWRTAADNAKAEAESWRVRHDKHKEELSRTLEEVERNRAEAESWRVRHDKHMEELSTTRENAARHRAEAESWRVKHDKHMQELSITREEMARQQAETESWRLKHNELAASSSAEIEKVRNSLAKMQEEARAAADKAKADAESWRIKADSLQGDLKALRATNDVLMGDLNAAKSESSRLKMEAESLQSTIKRLQGECVAVEVLTFCCSSLCRNCSRSISCAFLSRVANRGAVCS